MSTLIITEQDIRGYFTPKMCNYRTPRVCFKNQYSVHDFNFYYCVCSGLSNDMNMQGLVAPVNSKSTKPTDHDPLALPDVMDIPVSLCEHIIHFVFINCTKYAVL